MARPKKEKVILHGVSLEQLAGVRTALAEGLSISDVLEQEGIGIDTWPLAERAWREAIASSVEHQLELARKTCVAEDCLSRSVSPLGDDASAWVGLLCAMSASSDPESLLEKLGITMTDVARLGRHWKRRAEADPNLGKQLADLAPRAKAPELVTVAEAVLRPFPWTPQRARVAEALPVARAAPLVADVPVASAPPQVQLATYQLREQQSPHAAVASMLPQPSYLLGNSPASPAAPASLQSLMAATMRKVRSSRGRRSVTSRHAKWAKCSSTQ